MEYEVVRSRRKTAGIEVTGEGRVILRVPLWLSDEDIKEIVDDREDVIIEYLRRQKKRSEMLDEVETLSDGDIAELKSRAGAFIPPRAQLMAEKMGLSFNRVSIKVMRSRWGSCSSKKNLNFNALIMLMPKEIIDYVIVHELCHLKEMNHSERFWKLVGEQIPDYREKRKWLRTNGDIYMKMGNML